ncbi:MAG: hypothetical protein ACREAX_00590, partial [Candidatus Nitrosotenuis sp.]
VLDDGQRVVENGLVINGRAFDVEHQTQDIPTMTFNTGSPSKVKLMVYENNGVSSFRHASITITDYQDDRSQNDLASILLDQDFTGAQTFEVIDADGYLKSVTAKATHLDLFRTEVEFSFKVVTPFDTTDLIVELWDEDQSSRLNVFIDAVRGTGEPVTDYVPGSANTTPAPLRQVADGVAPQDVECREGLELVIRTTGAPACVYPFTAEILRNWGMVA